jgi:hypothetical protein
MQWKALITGALFALAALFVSFQAKAEDEAMKPAEVTKNIVDMQIKAFLTKDHDTAYGFAAPVIKRMYPDSSSFAAMVKRGYPAIYEPSTYSFGRATERDGQHYLEVQLTDKKGGNWVALYTLGDFSGEWRITGVFLRRSQARPT